MRTKAHKCKQVDTTCIQQIHTNAYKRIQTRTNTCHVGLFHYQVVLLDMQNMYIVLVEVKTRSAKWHSCPICGTLHWHIVPYCDILHWHIGHNNGYCEHLTLCYFLGGVFLPAIGQWFIREKTATITFQTKTVHQLLTSTLCWNDHHYQSEIV